MNRKIAAVLVALSIAAGIGLGYAVNRINDQPASADASPTRPTPSAKAPTKSVAKVNPPASSAPKTPDLTISPGRVGPVSVGMTEQEAIDTGLIERDSEAEEACGGTYYRWKPTEARSALDVLTAGSGTVVSLGVSRGTYPTTTGIRVGDRLSTVQEAYGENVSAPEEAGYGQSGVFVSDGDRWLGFLFDQAPDQVDETSRVTFMEVTRGSRPGLMRDGC